ncbi:hypothetical protein BU23DRAFT_564940 [Bimuria novae-zelandiae CBS 107.79]|uniref:Transcription factor domain-containing protein n=1 Tax=Bimuria novae-zelandiae CBS 107.79 TaxID=1447943 RepID=A0A6A5VLK9_9PLEO|nr:hypothetical protein BU23DRAFT_564940 [Bimuria novae-zelandiae CBS 107.79]
METYQEPPRTKAFLSTMSMRLKIARPQFVIWSGYSLRYPPAYEPARIHIKLNPNPILQKQQYKQWDLLAAFQAYIIYVTLLLNPAAEPVIDQSIMLNLQDSAHTIALNGLVHASEHAGYSSMSPKYANRPYPQSLLLSVWALGEATRRSLFAMYMLDDVVNTFSNVSCILGDELSDLLPPCSEKLWRARDEGVWRRVYDMLVA